MKARPTVQKTGAVIYCRVSTKEQQQNLSLASQEKTCREYCDRNGLEIIRLFKEAESAKTVNRTQFQEMLEFCELEHKRIVAVVFYDASRFSRDTADYLAMRALLRKRGIETRSATQPFDSSPGGEFMESILASAAKFDNRMRAVRTVEGMKAA
jgi:site-specific DNA recombinase